MKTTIKSIRISTEIIKRLEEKGIDTTKEIKKTLSQLADADKCPTCNQQIKKPRIKMG
jgi:hypothetical protein